MWARQDGEHDVGKGLLHFIFWMFFQAFVIIVLELLHILPGDFFEEPLQYKGSFYYPDTYMVACTMIGTVYTFVGCLVIRKHEVNTKGWWFWVIGLYLAYLPLTYLFFDNVYGLRILDVWAAPLLWALEIELVYHIQKTIAKKHSSETV